MSGKIDIDRINRRLDTLWEIGRTSKGGVTRLAYSDEENEAHEYLISELPDFFACEIDSTGNVFASPNHGTDRTVMIGSHLDTVFNGGRLDGTLGVVLGLEAMEAMYESGEEPAVVPTLAIFRGEESSRFGHHTLGSRAALGILDVETFASTDQNNIPMWQAIQQSGFQPENLSEPSIDYGRITGYFETHIEQGRVLDDLETDLGIVESIRAPVRYNITITGSYDHSGATPMKMRRDALAAAGEVISTVERIAREADAEGDIVATIGDIHAIDGAINKVCGQVELVLDIRSADADFREEVEETMITAVEEIAEKRDLGLDLDLIDKSDPIVLEQEIVNFLLEETDQLGYSHMSLPSGGGHDAMNFEYVGVPTGMLFVPSIDGISHDPAEETTDEAMVAAADVLRSVLLSYDRPVERSPRVERR